MIPHDLAGSPLSLPETDRHTIVLITGAVGSDLPYERFALRMQEEFGPLVVAWFQYRPKPAHRGPSSRLGAARRRVREELRQVYLAPGTVWRWPRKALGTFRERVLRQSPLARAQTRLFREEVEQLRGHGRLTPTPVEDPSSSEFIAEVRRLDPYFFLSLGGPLYTDELLRAVRGIALNQHAGWSPQYRGSHTIAWALYHRDLDCVGATVHQTTSGADAGPIFRRAQACLLPDDDMHTCFARAVALGTELMCETVHELIADKRPVAYPQPRGQGRTYRAADLDGATRDWIAQDLAHGWLGMELERSRRF
jgi:methionyl-tRNA formyltransferase